MPCFSLPQSAWVLGYHNIGAWRTEPTFTLFPLMASVRILSRVTRPPYTHLLSLTLSRYASMKCSDRDGLLFPAPLSTRRHALGVGKALKRVTEPFPHALQILSDTVQQTSRSFSKMLFFQSKGQHKFTFLSHCSRWRIK